MKRIFGYFIIAFAIFMITMSIMMNFDFFKRKHDEILYKINIEFNSYIKGYFDDQPLP